MYDVLILMVFLYFFLLMMFIREIRRVVYFIVNDFIDNDEVFIKGYRMGINKNFILISIYLIFVMRKFN